ncbi:YbhB/YbcL family Raf kinase inhibitor-like protein [Chryseobacterium balustinum]|uniref:Kinase inhibitor n=1 Tax=Chryseobacterium balustinum TaxID=246 RepID=A0AAX2ILI2_9FLAO|nr:YbhB/YbcL family Raf kinase inhibitor-like protein [Chryseobacterium balustinum]AZB29753.1 YbhB/YbcL family Raf kinase inhibitor-like protein [Chryseobacterium balustinum]SKC13381.1 phospholipid-binding protein, PBP family [Chryseobacterium balustinum]SQA90120.1 putative kinase inhibitor [Chryseobacterium balustinum]
MKKTFFSLLFSVITLNTFAQTFTIKSTELGGQATKKQMSNSMGCNGDNISPQLYWENVPKNAQSFAITVHDENAPTGSGWWHWLVFDIPSAISELKSNAGNIEKKLAPKNAIQSKTDFGISGYGGPCPPSGSGFHKYTVLVAQPKILKINFVNIK